MAKRSAGIMVYRSTAGHVEVLLVHPGGPFWAKKDTGAWSIPKGEYTDAEKPFVAAKREFQEELGLPAPEGEYVQLTDVKQSGGKIVSAWMIEAEIAVEKVKSNTFMLEWPPKSGHNEEFPEVDKTAWFPLKVAARKINKGQLPLLDELSQKLGVGGGTATDASAQTSLF